MTRRETMPPLTDEQRAAYREAVRALSLASIGARRRGRSTAEIDDEGVVHIRDDRGFHAMMSPEVYEQLVSLPPEQIVLADEQIAQMRGDVRRDLPELWAPHFIADRVAPVIEGRNRHERRANAARARRSR